MFKFTRAQQYPKAKHQHHHYHLTLQPRVDLGLLKKNRIKSQIEHSVGQQECVVIKTLTPDNLNYNH